MNVLMMQGKVGPQGQEKEAAIKKEHEDLQARLQDAVAGLEADGVSQKAMEEKFLDLMEAYLKHRQQNGYTIKDFLRKMKVGCLTLLLPDACALLFNMSLLAGWILKTKKVPKYIVEGSMFHVCPQFMQCLMSYNPPLQPLVSHA